MLLLYKGPEVVELLAADVCVPLGLREDASVFGSVDGKPSVGGSTLVVSVLGAG